MTNQINRQLSVKSNEVSFERICDYLANRYGMDRGQAEQIMETYAGVLLESFRKLQSFLQDHDGKSGSCQAHTLKGAFLNLGLPEQADIAAILEKELCKNITKDHVIQVESLILELRPVTEKYPGEKGIK